MYTFKTHFQEGGSPGIPPPPPPPFPPNKIGKKISPNVQIVCVSSPLLNFFFTLLQILPAQEKKSACLYRY